jgi:hypothetical protein
MNGIEAKVQASTAAAALSGAILWALSAYVFKGTAVPPGLVSLVDVAVPALCALAAGYRAPHTHRPDLAPPPAPPSNITITPPAT